MGANASRKKRPVSSDSSPELLGSTKRVNVNSQDTDGFSALHHATLNGNTELLLLLLEAQAAVDIKDNKGMRPLHYAAWQGKKEPMKMLLKAGSSVNIPSDEGQIPLHLAAQHGHYYVSEMLLQHQSNPCILDNSGKMPLDLACEFGHVRVVQLLLNSNMCAVLPEPKPGDITDPNGTSPLHLAAKNGHIDIIRLLLQSGIDINWQTKAGTALHKAALCGKTEVVRLLLDNGINAHIRNTYSQTALDIVNQFTATQASKEIKQMLRDASAALQVRAIKDYCNNFDLTSLNVKAGDIITVLEQHADGRWKGCIHDNQTGNDCVGYFPSSLVEAISKRTGSQGSDTSPFHLLPGGDVCISAPAEEIWVLRKPYTGSDHSSVGSTGSMASGRSTGSGQSTGSGGHMALHPGAEGVKLLATVHSQNVPVQESFLGDGPSKAASSTSEGAPGSSQTPSLGGSSFQSQSYGEQQPKKVATMSKGKSSDAVYQWLCKFQLQLYAPHFINAGYDIPTISRMTPEDLTAIGVTKPGHRKKIASEINNLNISEWLPEYKPANLVFWLSMIGLAQYHKVLVENGYENIDFITDITWEDLQEIGITKLGHQKKLMLAVKKLAEIQKAEFTKYESGTLKKKGPPQDMVAIESPQQELAECQSPKMTTFQDSELSNELQVAMTGEEGSEKQGNHVGHVREGTAYHHGSHLAHKNSLSGRAKQMSSSQELLGDGSKPSSSTMSKSQKYLVEDGKESPVMLPKEVRMLHHGYSVKRASVPPVRSKPWQSFPSSAGHYTLPQTPTKPCPSSPQTLGMPHAKVKPTTQLLSPRSLPQSPAHRGFAYVMPQPIGGDGHAIKPLAPAVPVLPVSVPVLCLPPQTTKGEEEAGRPKKRAHSLNRYTVPDSEQGWDELLVPNAGPYATVQRRVGRSHSVCAQLGGDKNVNRSQSFAVRPKKKGPPPPPPKRSSSAISSTNMSDDFTKEGEEDLEPPEEQQQQRQASDSGRVMDTGSIGSVKRIAAMLEMSSIGGGGRGLVLQKPLRARKGPNGYYLQPGAALHPVSPDHARVTTVMASVKHKDAIGLDGEVVNRRRTISGPITGLMAATRRERSDSIKSESGPRSEHGGASQNASAENIPFAEDRSLTIRQQLRQMGVARGEAAEALSLTHWHGDLSKVEASATLKRRIRAKQSQQDSIKFLLTESDTVKRRPKLKDKEQEPSPLSVYQNGMATMKRRLASETSSMEAMSPAEQQERYDYTVPLPPPEGEPKNVIKLLVSPKTVLSQKVSGPSTPTSKKAPISGPGNPEMKCIHGTPPLISPKPTPPPTAPKPKVHEVLQSVSASSTPAPSPAKQLRPTAVKPSSTPPSLCSSPAKPLSPSGSGGSGILSHMVPVKPLRSTIVGPSLESNVDNSTESVHQKLEETSASLAAALQVVEEKIKQEDCQPADSAVENKSTVSILDDIGSMFNDLADQLDAMLE